MPCNLQDRARRNAASLVLQFDSNRGRMKEKEKPSGPFERAEHGWGLRSIARATSPDFVHWSSPVEMCPNLPGEHLYAKLTHPYFRAPHITWHCQAAMLPGGWFKKDHAGLHRHPLMSSGGAQRIMSASLQGFIRPRRSERWHNRGNYVALN